MYSKYVDVRLDTCAMNEHKCVLKGRVRERPFPWRSWVMKLEPPNLQETKARFFMEMTDKETRAKFYPYVRDYLLDTHPAQVLGAAPVEIRRNPPQWFTEKYPSLGSCPCTFLESDKSS